MKVTAQGKAIRPAQEYYRLHKAQNVKRYHDRRGKDYKVQGGGGAIGLAEHPAEDLRFNNAEVKGYPGQVLIVNRK